MRCGLARHQLPPRFHCKPKGHKNAVASSRQAMRIISIIQWVCAHQNVNKQMHIPFTHGDLLTRTRYEAPRQIYPFEGDENGGALKTIRLGLAQPVGIEAFFNISYIV